LETKVILYGWHSGKISSQYCKQNAHHERKFNQHWNIYHSHFKWLVTSYIWGYQCVAYMNTMGLWAVWSHQCLLQWRLTYLLNCELLVKRHLMVEMPMMDFHHYTDLLNDLIDSSGTKTFINKSMNCNIWKPQDQEIVHTYQTFWWIWPRNCWVPSYLQTLA